MEEIWIIVIGVGSIFAGAVVGSTIATAFLLKRVVEILENLHVEAHATSIVGETLKMHDCNHKENSDGA